MTNVFYHLFYYYYFSSLVIWRPFLSVTMTLIPEWDWEGKTYKVKGKYLPLTNPKYGVCLEEYDGKPKLEIFEDDAGFETVAFSDYFL